MHISSYVSKLEMTWPPGYKTFSMLNSTEHEVCPAHKCNIYEREK